MYGTTAKERDMKYADGIMERTEGNLMTRRQHRSVGMFAAPRDSQDITDISGG